MVLGDGRAEASVSRAGFGSVRWLDPVDVGYLRGLDDISRVVRIERGCVTVYDETCGVPAPERGEGLRRRAEVTLLGCAATSTAAGAKEKYEEKVIRKTRRMGADLIEYDGVTGTWRFAINL